MTKRVLLALGSILVVGNLPALADVPRAADVPPLIRKLTYGDAKARAEAAREIGEIGLVKASYTKPAVPALLNAARRDQDVSVRRAALVALGRVDPDPKLALPVFLDAMKEKDDQVKIAAAEGVSHLGGDAQPAMPELRKIREELNKLDKKERDKRRNVMQAVNDAMQAIQSSPRKGK